MKAIADNRICLKERFNKLICDKSGEQIGFKLVFAVYILLAGLYFLLANYDKIMIIYNDEIYYFNMAKNIAAGNGFVIDGLGGGFQKILYSLFLSPSFLIQDPVMRIKATALINSLTMASAVFPVWLIAKDIKLSKKGTLSALLFAAVFPDSLIYMFYMAECVYYPLTLLFVHLWIVNYKNPSVKNGIILGAVGFLCYLAKECFIAVMISCAVIEIIFPVISYFLSNRLQKLKTFYSKKSFVNLLVFAGTFFLLYIAAKMLVFPSGDNIYKTLNSIPPINGFDAYKFSYFIYSFLYYIASVLICVFVLPFIYPLLQYKKLDDISKKLYFFVLVNLTSVILGIAYSISATEDYGHAMPRIITRYFAGFILLSLMIFIKSLEYNYNELGKTRPQYWWGLLCVSILPCVLFKGSGSFIWDYPLGGFYNNYKILFGTLTLDRKHWYEYMEAHNKLWMGIDNPLDIDLFQVFFGLVLVLIVALFHYFFTHKKEKIAKKSIIGFLSFVLIFDCSVQYYKAVSSNSADAYILSDALKIGDYLKEDSEYNILYITGKVNGRAKQHLDSYLTLNKNQHIYPITKEGIELNNPAENNYLSEDIKIPSLINGYSKYDGIIPDTPHSYNYILVDSEADFATTGLKGVEEVPLNLNFYKLYKNTDPSTVIIQYNESIIYGGSYMKIENEDLGKFYSVSHTVPKSENLEMLDICFNFKIPVKGGLNSAYIRLNLQESEIKKDNLTYYSVFDDEKHLSNGILGSNTSHQFKVEVKDGYLSFEIIFAEAGEVSSQVINFVEISSNPFN